MRKCTCDLRTKLVGDGCEVCNPSLALDYAKEQIAVFRALVGKLVGVVEVTRGMALAYADTRHDLDQTKIAKHIDAAIAEAKEVLDGKK